MSNSNHDLIAQRFAITSTTLINDVTFHDTTDTQSKMGQAISPTPSAQLRKGAEEYFRSTHNQKAIWQGKHQQSLVAVYDEPLSPITIMPTLSFDEANQLLSNLIVQAQEEPHPFIHGLRTTDLGINKDGHMIIRASGVLPKTNHVRPEIIETQGTPLQKALYGIAVHVFSTLTSLPTIESKRALEEFQTHPPVLADILPDAPQHLSTLLTTMMHPSPEMREEALIMMEEHPPLVLPIPDSDTVQPHREESQAILPTINTRRDLPLPQWLIFSKEKSIPINVARRISVFSEIHPNSITTNSLRIPLAGADTQEEAQRIAQRIVETGVDVEVRHQDSAPKISTVFGASLLLSFASYLLASSPFMIILPIILGIAITITLGFFSSNKKQQAYKKWNESHAPENVHSSILQGQHVTRNARKAIISSAVPELAKIDLHASIDEIDDILDGYDETQTAIPTAMLNEIHATCSDLIADLNETNQQENRILNIRKRTQQVQKIARQMRSL